MARSHIHKTQWNLPEDLAVPLRKVQDAVDELKAAANHDFLKFTLDGRLVGDLGEAIAEHYFAITLYDSQHTGHDGTLNRNGLIESVEVKIRRESTNIWFDSEPDHIIAFRLERGNAQVTLIYAGPGSVLRKIRPDAEHDKTIRSDVGATIRKFKQRQTISLNQLAKYFNYEDFMNNPSIPFKTEPTPLPLLTDH